MSRFESRAIAGLSDLPLLIDFARRRTLARPRGLAYYHPGDITWQLYRAGATEDVRIWFDGGRVAAFAIYERPLNFQYDLEPGDDGLAREVLAWAEDQRAATPDPESTPIAYQMLGASSLSTSVFESDWERITTLADSGYRPIERGAVCYARDLAGEVTPPPLPAGTLLRHATGDDIEERADLHRDAWSVWGPSRFTANAYRRLRSAPGYDETLDVVVEFEGRLVSSCICWADEVSSVGRFEPTGTRPSFAGKGFGRAAIMEGFRRLKQCGMRTATVSTASVNEPGQRLYAACGFEVVDRERFYTKQVR